MALKLTVIIASSGSSIEVECLPSTTGMELKQKIAEDTSIETDHQVLFTQNGHKLKMLSHPLSHSSYHNDLFIPSNSDDTDTTTFTIAMPPHLFLFDKHHGERPSMASEFVLDPKSYAFTLNDATSADSVDLNVVQKVQSECIRKMNASKKCVKTIQHQYKSLKACRVPGTFWEFVCE